IGFAEDALARVRTLFELALDLQYMMRADDPQETAQRWLDWATVIQHRLLGVLERGDDNFDDLRSALSAKPDEKAAVLEAIERVKAKGTHWFTNAEGKHRLHGHWSGQDAAALA